MQKTIEFDPDSVTVYQMELPYNTAYSKDLLAGDGEPLALADWKTKRAWHAYAFEQLAAAGYVRSSAYTMKKTSDARFVYRDAVWTGQDMLGTGVASFSHLSGVHYQNAPQWDEYLATIDRGGLPHPPRLCHQPRRAAHPRGDPTTQIRRARHRRIFAPNSASISSPILPLH